MRSEGAVYNRQDGIPTSVSTRRGTKVDPSVLEKNKSRKTFLLKIKRAYPMFFFTSNGCDSFVMYRAYFNIERSERIFKFRRRFVNLTCTCTLCWKLNDTTTARGEGELHVRVSSHNPFGFRE